MIRFANAHAVQGDASVVSVVFSDEVKNVQQFFSGTFGRLRTVEPAPDGGMWMTNSSGDKDSTPNNSNDKVWHVQLG